MKGHGESVAGVTCQNGEVDVESVEVDLDADGKVGLAVRFEGESKEVQFSARGPV